MCCCATRSGSAPGRTTCCAPQRGVPRGELGRGGRRRQGAHRPRGGRVPHAGRGAGRGAASLGSRGGPCRRSVWLRRRQRPEAEPGRRATWTSPLSSPPTPATTIVLAAQPAPLYHGETGRVVDDLKRWSGDGLVDRAGLRGPRPGPAGGRGAARRRARRRARWTRIAAPPAPGEVLVTCGSLQHGFLDEAARLAIVTGNDITGGRGASTRDMRKMPSRRRNHDRPAGAAGRRLRGARAARHRPLRRDGAAHGQRRRPGIPGHRVRRRASGASPATGSSCPPTSSTSSPATSAASSPRCTRWAARTGRSPRRGPARRSAEIAAQLIQLYAARKASKGHAFGPDTPWQRELEDAFPYTETPDQLAAIEEVKRGHGAADPDGPADLRRRRLRQDRDRGAGGVQGGAGRQAGRRAGADDAAGPAALQHVHRADEPVPGRDPAAVPLPDAEGDRARRWTMVADGTVDIVIGTHRLLQTRPGSSSSAWSSSTRSSASASSTRST